MMIGVGQGIGLELEEWMQAHPGKAAYLNAHPALKDFLRDRAIARAKGFGKLGQAYTCPSGYAADGIGDCFAIVGPASAGCTTGLQIGANCVDPTNPAMPIPGGAAGSWQYTPSTAAASTPAPVSTTPTTSTWLIIGAVFLGVFLVGAMSHR